MSQVVATLPNGRKFDFFVHEKADKYVSARIKSRGSWEPFETGIMFSLLQLGDGFIDIGANIGWHTVMSALRVGPGGRVTAFEPEADNASILDRNVTLNGLRNVTVFRCAVSDGAGTVRFAKSPTNLGDHRIVPGSGPGETTEVRTDSLDDMVSRNELSLLRTRIVKIDTQGAELLVFKGAKTTLASLPENAALFVEFSPNLLRKHNLSAPGEFIQVLGLTGRNIYVVNSRYRTIHPIGADELTRFAAGCSNCSEDVGMDLILAPRLDADLRRFIRWYAPLLKRRFLQKKVH